MHKLEREKFPNVTARNSGRTEHAHQLHRRFYVSAIDFLQNEDEDVRPKNNHGRGIIPSRGLSHVGAIFQHWPQVKRLSALFQSGFGGPEIVTRISARRGITDSFIADG